MWCPGASRDLTHSASDCGRLFARSGRFSHRWTSDRENLESGLDSPDEANSCWGNGLNDMSAGLGERPKTHLHVNNLWLSWIPRP